MRNRAAVAWLAAALSTAALSAARADVTDAAAKQWAAAALTAAGSALPKDNDPVLQKNYSAEAIYHAWERLKICRDAGRSLNLDLAAAEHYLFARTLASDSGDTNLLEAPKWYETFKKFSDAASFNNYIRTSTEPVSPTNANVTRWGVDGVKRGLQEYQARTGEAPSSKFAAFRDALAVAAAIVYKVKPTGACDVVIAPTGVWESAEPGKRWKLTISSGAVVWEERSAAGSIQRTVDLAPFVAEPDTLRIERPNDADVLTFLDISAENIAKVLSLGAKPSVMMLKVGDATLTGAWSGLTVIKDASGKFKEMKQPGQTPAKPYSFVRK